jgi:uncharacterized membrane-anchored protein YhcB (DUF1043 family)
MHAITDQNHPAGLTGLMRIMAVVMGVAITFVMMRVAQDRSFFKQKKKQQAAQ